MSPHKLFFRIVEVRWSLEPEAQIRILEEQHVLMING